MNNRAKEYGNAQRFRKPTTNPFGVRSTRSTLPAPGKGKEREEVAATPPSYKHADKQQGEKDVDAEERGKEDEAIHEDQGKNAESEEKPTTKFTKPTHRVKDNQPDTRGSTETSVRASQPFENYWALETSFDLEEVTYEKPNYWTPNALALFETLRASQRFTVNSRIINKHHPEYLEYGVACYYAVIFHLQILRAREAANRLTGEESTFLRRFRRKFPEESLPIAGHIFPILSSIVSVLLPDPKYNWIVPQTAPDMFNNTLYNTVNQFVTLHEGGPFIQPSVPMMLAILREAIAEARAGNLANGSHYIDEEYYVTNTFNDTTAVRVFGADFRLNQTAAIDANGIFNFVGISYPFDADQEQLSQASKHWARSSFNELGLRASGTGNIDISNIEQFFVMPKSGSMDWFNTLINQATTHARFFSDVKNVSDLPTTGGNEILVDTIMRKNDDTARIAHTTRHLGLILATGTQPWYPNDLRNMIAGFRTTRSAVQRAQILQALSFGMNASINVTIGTNLVGSGGRFRSGDFWNGVDWNLEKYTDTIDEGTATARAHGKPMFQGWETMIQEKFVRVKPEGY
nr:capsid protein [Sarcosphaera coronaria partitivirus]